MGTPGGIGSNQHVKKSKGDNSTLAKGSKRGSNKADYLIACIKSELGKELGNPGDINNPEGIGGKSDEVNYANGTINQNGHGSNIVQYLTTRLKRNTPEGKNQFCQSVDQACDTSLKQDKYPSVRQSAIDNYANNTINKAFSSGNQSDYLIAHTELGKDNQAYNVNLIKECRVDNVNSAKDCQRDNITLTKFSKGSLMNFLKKSQKYMTTPAFQKKDNLPTQAINFYQNANTRPTLPHNLADPTY